MNKLTFHGWASGGCLTAAVRQRNISLSPGHSVIFTANVLVLHLSRDYLITRPQRYKSYRSGYFSSRCSRQMAKLLGIIARKMWIIQWIIWRGHHWSPIDHTWVSQGRERSWLFNFPWCIWRLQFAINGFVMQCHWVFVAGTWSHWSDTSPTRLGKICKKKSCTKLCRWQITKSMEQPDKRIINVVICYHCAAFE